ESAERIDEIDADVIRELAEHGGTDAAHAEGEPEEQTRDHAGTPREQVLRVHHDGRKSGGEDEPDRHGEHTGPEEIRVRQQARERQDANLFRSEEHTSELQSRVDLVCRLLLEKKKKNKKQTVMS